jgi:hypothetical protein
VKLRVRTLVASTIAVLSIGTVAPGQAFADAPEPQATAAAVQTPGANDRWTVTASWETQPEATRYQVTITDADGTEYAGPKDVTAPKATFVTDALAGDQDYRVVIRPKPTGTALSASVHTPVLDTTAPTGTFRLDRTSVVLSSGLLSDEASAEIVLSQTSGDTGATRTVLAGDGTAAKPWWPGGAFTLRYTKAGVYHPSVQLTDGFANSSVVELGTVAVVTDETAPVVTITIPAKPGRVASWRRIHGSATDAGTGVGIVGIFVMEKRGSTWWAYDFKKKAWLKGYANRKKTEAKTKASPRLLAPSASGAWRTPAIKGLTKGTLVVQAAAIDGEFNIGARSVTRRIG